MGYEGLVHKNLDTRWVDSPAHARTDPEEVRWDH